METVNSHDYVSEGLSFVDISRSFPDRVLGDKQSVAWPFFRGSVAHNWYVDRRSSGVGFVSSDEAAILYNSARNAVGLPCLEIGCWRGWSAAHIAMGSGRLDVVDPVLSDPEFLEDVRGSLRRAGVLEQTNLYGGFSPVAIRELARETGVRWAFVFIDGDHEPGGPLRDAQVVKECVAEDAMVLFHDLASPFVAEGLMLFRDAGWNTMIYQTMQIMGVAWRGSMKPVVHIPDPEVQWDLPDHLLGFEVSGARIGDNGRRSNRFDSVKTLDPVVQRAVLETIERQALADARSAHFFGELQRVSSKMDQMSSLLDGRSARLIDEVQRMLSKSDEAVASTNAQTAHLLDEAKRISRKVDDTSTLTASRLVHLFDGLAVRQKLPIWQRLYIRLRAMVRHPASGKVRRGYFHRKARKRLQLRILRVYQMRNRHQNAQ